DLVGNKHHLAVALAHRDDNNARKFFWITRLTGRETSVILVSGRRDRHRDIRCQDRRGRCQQGSDDDSDAGMFLHGGSPQCPLWLFPGLTALGPALGCAAGLLRRGDSADELATSYATVPCGCL